MSEHRCNPKGIEQRRRRQQHQSQPQRHEAVESLDLQQQILKQLDDTHMILLNSQQQLHKPGSVKGEKHDK
jgi:hypothetical protein